MKTNVSIIILFISGVLTAIQKVSENTSPLLFRQSEEKGILFSFSSKTEELVITTIPDIQEIARHKMAEPPQKLIEKNNDNNYIFLSNPPLSVFFFDNNFQIKRNVHFQISIDQLRDVESLNEQFIVSYIKDGKFYCVEFQQNDDSYENVIAEKKAVGGFCKIVPSDIFCVVVDEEIRYNIFGSSGEQMRPLDFVDATVKAQDTMGIIVDNNGVVSCFFFSNGEIYCSPIILDKELRSNHVEGSALKFLDGCVDSQKYRITHDVDFISVYCLKSNGYAFMLGYFNSLNNNFDCLTRIFDIEQSSHWSGLNIQRINNVLNGIYYDNQDKAIYLWNYPLPKCQDSKKDFQLSTKDSEIVFDFKEYCKEGVNNKVVLLNVTISDDKEEYLAKLNYYEKLEEKNLLDVRDEINGFTIEPCETSLKYTTNNTEDHVISIQFSIISQEGMISQKCLLKLETFKCYSSCETCEEFGNEEDHKCIKCKGGYFPLDEKPSQCYLPSVLTPHIFFDEVNFKFYSCSPACYSCFTSPTSIDSNCFECNEGYIPHPLDSSNCVKKCENNNSWYLDKDDVYHCTTKCPEAYPILSEKDNQCLSSCNDEEKKFLYNNTCYKECPEDTYIDKQHKKCFSKPKGEITFEFLEEAILALPKREFLKGVNSTIYIYEATTKESDFAKEVSIQNNRTYLEFQECISVLKQVWNIEESENLIIARIEIERVNVITNKVGYKIFRPLGGRLDLSVCSDLNVKVNYLIKDTDLINLKLAKSMKEKEIDIYNGEDSFFNDFCLNFTSANKTDVTLKDRREDYFQNISYCEKGCTYLGIDLEKFRVECGCPIKDENLRSENDTTGSEEEEEEENENPPDFTDEITSSNYEVIVCYNQVFDFKKLKVNYGNYIILVMIFALVVIFIHYIIYGKKSIMKFIVINNIYSSETQTIFSMDKKKFKKPKHNTHSPPRKRNESAKSVNPISINPISISISSPVKTNETKENIKKIQLSKSKKLLSQVSSQKIPIKNNYTSVPLDTLGDISLANTNTATNIITTKRGTADFLIGGTVRKKSPPKKLSLLDYNEMPYETALLIDHRTFWVMYRELVISKQILLCLTLDQKVLLKQIKFSVFVVGTGMDFFFNALFYSDDYITRDYHLEGEMEFLLELPKSILAYVATALFLYFLEYLTSSKFLLMLINSRIKEKVFSQCNSFIRILRCKIKVYMSIGSLLMIFFWYYVSAFCAVFQNSQIKWIESTFISFGISMVAPFLTCLLVAVIRMLGLKWRSKAWFKISNFILLLS